jgi:hypothetical protein
VAKSKGWSFIIALLLGVAAASAFWLYGPYLEYEVSRRVAESVKKEPMGLTPGKVGSAAGAVGPATVAGQRYQLVTDGKNILLADLKTGRVWRYYHHTREGGFAREDEGFLPLSLHFEGKKYPSAGQVAQAYDKSAEPTASGEGEARNP